MFETNDDNNNIRDKVPYCGSDDEDVNVEEDISIGNNDENDRLEDIMSSGCENGESEGECNEPLSYLRDSGRYVGHDSATSSFYARHMQRFRESSAFPEYKSRERDQSARELGPPDEENSDEGVSDNDMEEDDNATSRGTCPSHDTAPSSKSTLSFSIDSILKDSQCSKHRDTLSRRSTPANERYRHDELSKDTETHSDPSHQPDTRRDRLKDDLDLASRTPPPQPRHLPGHPPHLDVPALTSLHAGPAPLHSQGHAPYLAQDMCRVDTR